MIPSLDARGLLPPGIYVADMTDLARFNSTPQRALLLRNLHEFCAIELFPWAKGMHLDVGGSFLSDKAEPPDLDITLRVPLKLVPEFNTKLINIGDQISKARIAKTYSIDFYVTIEGLGNDFSSFLQYAGEKTAATKHLHPKDRRGIARITL